MVRDFAYSQTVVVDIGNLDDKNDCKRNVFCVENCENEFLPVIWRYFTSVQCRNIWVEWIYETSESATECAPFWNRSPGWFKTPTTTIRVKTMRFRKYLDLCGRGKNWGFLHNCLEFLFGLNIVLEQRVLWPHWKGLNCFTIEKLCQSLVSYPIVPFEIVVFTFALFSYRARVFKWRHGGHILVFKTIKRRPCRCSKPILWELNSFLIKRFLLFQYICIDVGHVSENAL